MMGGITGVALSRVLTAYLQRTGTPAATFAGAAEISHSTMSALPRVAYPRKRIVDAIEQTIAAHPDGISAGPAPAGNRKIADALANSPPPARPAADAVARAAAEDRARQRRAAPVSLPVARPLAHAGLTPVERVQTLCVESPGELIAVVQRQWPQVWQRTLDAARSAGTLPGAMLVALIERGLEAEAS